MNNMMRFLSENWLDVSVLAIILGYIVWHVAAWFTRTEHTGSRIDGLEKSNEGLQRWQGEVDADRESFKEFMRGIRATINEILLRLPPKPIAMSESPLALTEHGKMLSREIDAAKWASEHCQEARKETAGKSPFDIQKFCEGYVNFEKLSADYQEKVKQVAFDNGLELDQLMRVLSIELRDVLLNPSS